MKKILFLCMLITCSAGVYAGGDSDTSSSTYSIVTRKHYANYLGIAGGYISGYGLSYRRWIGDSWGFQINAFPFYRERKYPDDPDYDYSHSITRDSGYSKNGNGSLGLAYLKRIASMKYSRVFMIAGANLKTVYERNNFYQTDETWDAANSTYRDTIEHITNKKLENKVSIGFGGGSEFYVWRFAFHIAVGLYGAYVIETDAYEVSPSVDGGVHFRF